MTKKSHSQDITCAPCTYTIEMGGTIDGEITRSPVGYQVYDQAFEPNLSVRMENVGDRPVRNPWLIANEKDWRSVSTIVNGVVEPGMTEEEKAVALWTFQRNHRFHASPYDRDNGNIVKLLNVYGYSLCGDDSFGLADLLREAGIRVRAGKPIGHTTTEAYWDGTWHLLDGDEHVICLMRDNRTIAGEAEIVADHDLMKRTHVYGILRKDDRDTDESSASLFPYEGERPEEKGTYPAHTMDTVLRPGESLTWRWGGRGRFHGRENMGSWRDAWSRICNGHMVYGPDPGGDTWRCGAHETKNVGDTGAMVLEREGEGSVTFELARPYVIVGGTVRAAFERADPGRRCALEFSHDGETWCEIWSAGETGTVSAEVDLDRHFPPDGEARYRCYVRASFEGDAGSRPLHALEMDTTLQMAPLSLPGLRLGTNVLRYVDDSDGERAIRISHAWRERTDVLPPTAPARPVYPEDCGETEGTRFTFEWAAPEDSGTSAIADYHFVLGRSSAPSRALSPNFEKLVSRTATRGTRRLEIPDVGLLNPDETCHWRVRARNAEGAWGPWSPTWRFTPRGPGVPVNVRLVKDETGRRATLAWDPGENGRRPALYRVYGSDERGFTVSDDPYPVLVANRKHERFPANFVAELEGRSLEIAGDAVDLPNANRAYYRVVAVDEAGNRSGASDMARMDTPLLVSEPVTQARVGERYAWRPEVVASIGDLRTIVIDGNPYNAAFRDGDALTYTLTEGPGWLSAAQNGELSGVPSEKGTWSVRLEVQSSRGGRDAVTWKLVVT